MGLKYRKTADLLQSLGLTRKQFAKIQHVDEEPYSHIKYLQNRATDVYGWGRNEETALRIVLVAGLINEHGLPADEACDTAARAIPKTGG